MTVPGFIDVAPEHWDALFAPSSMLAVITTVDEAGAINAAPVGTCTRVCHSPVCIAFTIGTGKDTYHNVLAVPQFVVNVPSFERAQLEKVNQMGVEHPPGFDEVADAALTVRPATLVKPPVIAEFSRHFECEVLWTKQWMNRMMVVGRVVAAGAHPGIMENGRIVWDRARSAHYAGYPYGNRFVAAHELMELDSPHGSLPPRRWDAP